MSASSLRLRWFLRDDYGVGELEALAASGDYSGKSSAWFHAKAIKDFARAITAYPLTSGVPLNIAGGYGAHEKLEQVHLGITVYPINARGYFGIHVKLATPLETGMRAESQSSTNLEILTTSESLARFGRELLGILDGNAGEALLNGDE